MYKIWYGIHNGDHILNIKNKNGNEVSNNFSDCTCI